MYYPDLAPYQSRKDPDTTRITIGWLDMAHPFPTSEPSHELVKMLKELIKQPVRRTRGYHVCPFCPGSADAAERYLDNNLPRGGAEIDVNGRSIIYAAPTLIAHYVEIHHYCPPEGFVIAAIQQAKHLG